MALNVGQGISSGMQGAQMGASFGPYGALAGGAIGLALGLFTPDYEKQAIKKYNDQVVHNNMQSIFDMRKVQNIRDMQTAQALAGYGDQSKVTRSTYNANYGAADIIGSSTTALAKTLQFQTQQAQAQTWFNFDVGVDNYNTSIDTLTNNSMNSLKRATGGASTAQTAGSALQTGLSLYSKFKGAGGTTDAGVGSSGSIADGSYVPSGAASPAGLSNLMNFGK